MAWERKCHGNARRSTDPFHLVSIKIRFKERNNFSINSFRISWILKILVDQFHLHSSNNHPPEFILFIFIWKLIKFKSRENIITSVGKSITFKMI